MSEDTRIVTTALDAYNRRDIAAVLEFLHPEVELRTVRAVLEGSVYRGHDGFKQFLRDMEEDWREFSLELDDLSDVGGGRVLVLGRLRALGRASGVELDAPAAWVCSLRDGKVAGVDFYADEQAAREAIAASQQSEHLP